MDNTKRTITVELTDEQIDLIVEAVQELESTRPGMEEVKQEILDIFWLI